MRRAADSEVVTPPPAGRVLGAFGRVSFTEGMVVLGASNVLALYTDGLTEAGLSREVMLTGDGVAVLLAGHAGQDAASQIVTGLMAGQTPTRARETGTISAWLLA